MLYRTPEALVLCSVFACFALVLFIVLMLTLALVQSYEDALASRCALKVLFIISLRGVVIPSEGVAHNSRSACSL